jgi:hypothetical protein
VYLYSMFINKASCRFTTLIYLAGQKFTGVWG